MGKGRSEDPIKSALVSKIHEFVLDPKNWKTLDIKEFPGSEGRNSFVVKVYTKLNVRPPRYFTVKVSENL